ncbi:hypothetical protein BDN72DRAFT_848404 [Pluteus cervinus]|uniref:Uncharacterized protein n=1 Tax=Pluteus cervinus TaxID=181527 RepID=A0ACD3AAG9_9AGAR|nr:hypothetical protein BDN72DRAFT_848404 [Pluteus cervinus]
MSSIYRPKVIHEILPFEVISLAFSFIDPNDPESGTLPTRLSLVCRTWRDIALDTAHIWTCVHVEVRKRVLTQELLVSIRKWLINSRGLPCRLHLEVSLRRSHELPLSLFSDLIGPIASRLEVLSLRVPARFLNGFFEIKPFKFPLLESFTFRFSADDNSPLVPLTSLPPTAFSESTSLHHLDLRTSSKLGFFSSKTIFPWHTITHLKINDPTISASDALEVFCLSTSLVHCELTMKGWPYSFTPGIGAPAPCIHLDLQVLWLDIPRGVIAPFFRPLSLPKLQDLRIEKKRDWGFNELGRALVALCTRQPIEGLKRFEAHGVGNSGTEPLVEFLGLNPAIETLIIEA